MLRFASPLFRNSANKYLPFRGGNIDEKRKRKIFSRVDVFENFGGSCRGGEGLGLRAFRARLGPGVAKIAIYAKEFEIHKFPLK